MAKKKFKFKITLGVHDPAGDRPEVRDAAGNVVIQACKGTKYIPAGTVVEMEEKEGQAIIDRHGAYAEPVTHDSSVITVQTVDETVTVR